MVTLIEHEHITGTLTNDMYEHNSIFRKSLGQIKPQEKDYHLNFPNQMTQFLQQFNKHLREIMTVGKAQAEQILLSETSFRSYLPGAYKEPMFLTTTNQQSIVVISS